MKKILFCISIMLCVISCQRYDDTQIKEDIKDLQEQVASKDDIVRFETYEKKLVKTGDEIKLVLDQSVIKDNYAGIKAEMAGFDGQYVSVATKSDNSKCSWKIEVANPEFGADGKVTKNPYVTVLATPANSTDGILTVTLIDSDGYNHVTSAVFTSEDNYADFVVIGKVFTSESDIPVEAFAVKDGRYIYVGEAATAKGYVKEGVTDVIDYTGRGLVMPTCGNGHAHYIMGMNTGSIGLAFDAQDTPEKVLAAVREAASRLGVTMVYGFGWTYQIFEQKMPKISELDDISKDIPIYLNDAEGHKGLVNSACLKAAGILDKDGVYHGTDGKEIRGGEICLTDGKPNGLLLEQAGTYVRSKGLNFNQMLTKEVAMNDILKTQDLMLSEGYTMYLDGWSNYFNETSYDAMLSLEEQNALKVNIGLSYEIESWNSENVDGELNKALKYKEEFDKRSRLAKANWIKLFIDGTVETGTGFCTQPYPDKSKGYGIVNWEQAEVDDISVKANAKGLSMHVHTMGDAAVKRAVDAFIKGNKEMRNTVVHVRNVDSEDYAKMADNDIYVTSGMLWHHMNPFIDEEVMKLIVPENLAIGSYPIKSFFDNGITVSSSTDYPALSASPDSPFGVMEIAVTGVDGASTMEYSGFPWWKPELISREQALKALTINCAKQMFLENERGSIKEGKYADFILVDKDVLSCDSNLIHNAKVNATYFEGEIVYGQ